MNKLHRIVALAVLNYSVMILYASGQELTEQQRQERCQTNRMLLNEYTMEKRELEIIQQNNFENRARSLMSALSKAITNNEIFYWYKNLENRKSTATSFNLGWDKAWEVDAMAFQKALRKRMTELILKRRGKSVAELKERTSYFETQIVMHQYRLRELRCDEKINASTEVDLSGEWSDDYGYSIKLNHSGGNITGTFSNGSNTGNFTSGSFDSKTCKVTLTYNEPWKQGTGNAELTLSEDGRTMRGVYVSKIPAYSKEQTGPWSFSRKGEAKGGCRKSGK